LAALATVLACCALTTGVAVLWQTDIARWGSLAFGTVALEVVLRLVGVPTVQQPPYWAAAALVTGSAEMLLRRRVSAILQPWTWALYVGSIGLSGVALLVAVCEESALLSDLALQPLAVTLALAGLTLVAHGLDRRERVLGYAGIACVLVAYMLQLTLFGVGQPQAFVVPVGIYLLLLAYVEGRLGSDAHLRISLELSALGIMLGASLAQALGNGDNNVAPLAYQVFLFFESLAVFGLGAVLHWKRSLFAGSAALVVDVGIVLANPLSALNTWYLMGIVGLLMIGLVIFLEEERRKIPLWIDQYRHRLETWI
jgi:hypothetical protein